MKKMIKNTIAILSLTVALSANAQTVKNVYWYTVPSLMVPVTKEFMKTFLNKATTLPLFRIRSLHSKMMLRL
jgi:hypothetical protein